MSRVLVALSVWASAAAAPAAPVPAELAELSCTACAQLDEVRSRFTADEWRDLLDGDEIVKDHDAGDGSDQRRETEAFGVVPWPPAMVWQVLVDFESRPNYMANSTESTIHKIDGNRIFVRQRLKILWENIGFAVVNVVDPARGSIVWHLDRDEPHDIADTSGSWQVVPLDGGRHTLLMYRSHTDTGRPVPAVIEGFLIKTSLPKMIDAVRGETARRGEGSRYLLPGGDSSERKNK